MGLNHIYKKCIARAWTPAWEPGHIPGADSINESSRVIRGHSVFANQLKLWVKMLVFGYQPT